MDAMRPHEPVDTEFDALLRRHRPLPEPEWVRATVEQLLPERRRRSRVLWLGAAAAGGLATLVLTLSLVGVGPLGGTDQAVQAEDDCRLITVQRQERVPRLVIARDGSARVVYTHRPVRRTERRCR